MPFRERGHEGEALIARSKICAVATVGQRNGLDEGRRRRVVEPHERIREPVVRGPVWFLMELARSKQAEVAAFHHHLSGTALRAFLAAESADCEAVTFSLFRDQVDHGGESIGSVQYRTRSADDLDFLQRVDWEGFQQVADQSTFQYFAGWPAVDEEQDV